VELTTTTSSPLATSPRRRRSITDGKGQTTQEHYIVVWKRVGGEWKLHRDIWN
jgi:ketosteroid isomerase-like protein